MSPFPQSKIRIMAEEKRYTLTEATLLAMAESIKEVRTLANSLKSKLDKYPDLTDDDKLITSVEFGGYALTDINGLVLSPLMGAYYQKGEKYTDKYLGSGKLTIPCAKSNAAGLIPSTLFNRINQYPDITDTMKTDGKAYALVNGVYDDICPADGDIMVQMRATAQSLALKSLQQGVLVLEDADEAMIDEMRELLGEDRFNELAAASVQTMELKPRPSIEEQIEQAKADYDARKAEALAQAEAVASSDVEPLKQEKI